jgi:hypothetical protein
VRGKSRETGEPVMCMEFVPHTGTRAEFMEEFIAKFEEWMPHVYRDRNFKFMSKLQLQRMSSPEEMATPTMMITRADFGTAVQIYRLFSDTCSFPERFNVCCTVAVYRPRVVKDYRQRRKWGKKRVGQPLPHILARIHTCHKILMPLPRLLLPRLPLSSERSTRVTLSLPSSRRT